MAAHFWRLRSMQHWPDEVRRLAGVRTPAAADRTHAAEGETLVEALTADELEAHRADWRDLARRAIEPNPFMEPDFALTAMLHLPASLRPVMAVVWQGAGGEPRARMIGVWGFEQGGGAFGGVARSWKYKHGALGTPLIDRLAAARSVDAVLHWLRARRLGRSALVMRDLARGGEAARLIAERCAAHGLGSIGLNEHERAALRPSGGGASPERPRGSRKRRRETDRLARRLAEAGEVMHGSASDPGDIRYASEWFLALEQAGWKGRRHTAFLSDAGDAAFLRATLRQLARAGKCRIDWIAVDGRPIAMAIVLRSGDRAYYWKTAYDERFARYSPGVQLTRMLAERQLEDPAVQVTDSCAIANHPMIDRLWPDRQAMFDLAIGVDPARANAFPGAVRRERLARALRAAAKSAANAALRRRVS
ncbi:MAG TPA: GNAT family N-acetyltransferase [Rhodoblastus sp.]|nr:GNAT family N-acetyltransferase [Rhodoblastus sp.]